MKHYLGCIVSCTLLLACGKASFGGKGAAIADPPKTASSAAKEEGVLNGVLASPCKPSDTEAVLESKNIRIPNAAKKCMDDGFMFNFGDGECTELGESSSLTECSEDGIRKFADELGVDLDSHLKKLKNGDARFITCAEDADKRAVVLQWIIPPQGELDHDTSKCVVAEQKNVYHLCIPKGAGEDCPSAITSAFSQ